MKSKLYQLVKEELEQMVNEFAGSSSRDGNMSVHPFANALANKPSTAPQENLYDELSNAVIMEMVSAYSEDQIREIIRFFTTKASQGAEGIGGKFTDEQVDEILMLIFEKVEEKIGIKLGSYMPQDREHPKYMDME